MWNILVAQRCYWLNDVIAIVNKFSSSKKGVFWKLPTVQKTYESVTWKDRLRSLRSRERICSQPSWQQPKWPDGIDAPSCSSVRSRCSPGLPSDPDRIWRNFFTLGPKTYPLSGLIHFQRSFSLSNNWGEIPVLRRNWCTIIKKASDYIALHLIFCQT